MPIALTYLFVITASGHDRCVAAVSNPLGKAGFGVAVAFLGVGAIAQLASSHALVVRAIAAACGALLVVAEIRIAVAGVVQRDGLVVVRNWTRTRTIPRSEIAEVAVVSSGNVTNAATCVAFRLADGRLIKAMPTASYSAKKVEGYQTQLMLL